MASEPSCSFSLPEQIQHKTLNLSTYCDMFPHATAILVPLLVLASLFTSTSATAQTTPPASTDPSVKLEDILNTLPPTERAERLTAAAEAGIVFGDDAVPGVFDALLTGRALDRYMDSWAEPFTAAKLDALERLVQSKKDESARFRAAVLLVRYGRDGQTFLSEQLRSGNQRAAQRAALVLAVAQVQGTEQAVVAALVASKKPDWDLAQALARWSDDELADALSKALIAQSSRTDLVLAQPKRVVMPPEVGFHHRFTESPDSQTLHLQLASALIRMDQLSAKPIEYLRRELLRPEAAFPLWKSYVVDAMGVSGSQAFLGDLRTAIEHAIAQGSNAERTRDQKSADARIAVHALRAISRLRGPIPVDLLPSLYELDGNFGGSRLLDLVLLESNDPTLIEFTRRRLSDQDIDLTRSLLNLRRVPREYLPRTSQLRLEDM